MVCLSAYLQHKRCQCTLTSTDHSGAASWKGSAGATVRLLRTKQASGCTPLLASSEER